MHGITLDPAAATSVTRVRVRFADTDLMGIVHHGRYLEYFELARVDWLRRRGGTYAEWAARGAHLAVVEANVKYKLPARFDDLLEVHTTLTQLGFASVRFEYQLRRGGVVLTEAYTRLGGVDGDGRIRRFDDAVLSVLLAPDGGAVGETA